MRHRRSLLLAGIVVGMVAIAQASPSHVVQYQGRLTDSNGVPREGVVGKLTFRLYSTAAPTSATFLWGEQHSSVPANRGVFTVQLGSGNARVDVNGALTTGANPFVTEFDGGPRYIQVQVDDDPPLAPTTRLGSVPFAVAAGGSVPVGGVIDWYRPSPSFPVPDGWAICDGAVVADPDSPFDGQPTPNLVNRFTAGLDPAAMTATQYGAGTPTPLPVQGGSNSVNLAHNHNGGFHQHDAGSHTHSMSHTHSPGSMRTSIDENRVIFNGPPFTHRTDFLAGDENHDHSITGETGQPSTSTTGAASGNTGGPDRQLDTSLGSVDTRPPFVGMLKIMRVR